MCQAVKKALVSQVVDALDAAYLAAAYLAALQNPATSIYSDTICNLMAHLLHTYGKISLQQVK